MKYQARIFLCVVILSAELANGQVPSTGRLWVFFKNKGSVNLQSINPASINISERALKRRTKVLPANRLIDELDLPVAKENREQLQSLGITIHGESRWLNALSVNATASQLSLLQHNPDISEIRLVATQKRSKHENFSETSQYQLQKTMINGIDYGNSLTQHTRSRVVDVHALGINGSGILLGMGDDGFNYHRIHDALKNIPVVAEYDFVQRDNNTSIAAGEYPGQGNHGQATLSIAAGFQGGFLIGASYGVSVVLAKTEIDSVEVTFEEDNYVEALEWMERLGVDIISTSLGYDDIDPMGIYNTGDIVYNMKNGRTGKTSIAASILARKGVLLVTAMGNEGWAKKDTIARFDSNNVLIEYVWGTKSGTGSLITPADADSIISVGAASSSGLLTYFSSTGPTSEGRIKPEVVNQGAAVYFDSGSAGGISSGGGTSYATPLTAGAAALVLSAHPELTPMQVREALMSTANRAINDSRMGSLTYPNNYYGWGHVNALDAVLYWGLVFSNHPTVAKNETAYIVSTKIKSKLLLTTDSLFLFHKKLSESTFKRVALNATGIGDEYAASINETDMDSTSTGYISARDNSGIVRKNPYNGPDSVFSLKVTSSNFSIASQPINSIPKEFTLRNYPNPFNPTTTILFDAPQTEEIDVSIFNILGQRIKILYRGVVLAGNKQFQWNGTNEHGIASSAGVYVVRLKTKSNILTSKLVLLK